MSLWDRIRGRKASPRIKPPAPPRTPPRPYGNEEGLRIKTPEQYLHDGGDRDRPSREARGYDDTVSRLRRDRESLARDNDQLRRDRDAAWDGNPPSGMYYSAGYGDYLYQGPDVMDLTGERDHHEHHHHHHYDQDDDHTSHMHEDYEADQSAAATAAEPVDDRPIMPSGAVDPTWTANPPQESAPAPESSSYDSSPAQESYSSPESSSPDPSSSGNDSSW